MKYTGYGVVTTKSQSDAMENYRQAEYAAIPLTALMVMDVTMQGEEDQGSSRFAGGRISPLMRKR
ncbi:MAG: hypothetical protein PHN98_06990 [Smithellaceae bacterium]|nr:hypothetical protein [Smithellaceae bacterium]